MNLIDEYAAAAQVAYVREHAGPRTPRHGRRLRRHRAESRHRTPRPEPG